MPTQNVITYSPPFVKIITGEDEFEEVIKDSKSGEEKKVKRKVYDLLNDKKLFPIINILRSGPLTIKEIRAGYNLLVEKPKNEMTIYRYVKLLEKGGLVSQAGRRVDMAKNATEILYCRTGTVFYTIDLSRKYWDTDAGNEVIEMVSSILKIYPKFKLSSEECLRDLIIEIFTKVVNEVSKILEDTGEKNPDLFTGKTYVEMSKAIDILQIFALLANPEFYEEEWNKCVTG